MLPAWGAFFIPRTTVSEVAEGCWLPLPHGRHDLSANPDRRRGTKHPKSRDRIAPQLPPQLPAGSVRDGARWPRTITTPVLRGVCSPGALQSPLDANDSPSAAPDNTCHNKANFRKVPDGRCANLASW